MCSKSYEWLVHIGGFFTYFFFNTAQSKSRMGPNLASMIDGPISLSVFWPKTPGHQVCHEQRHCHDARSEHQARVQVFSDEQPHVTLPIFPITMLVHCSTLFKKFKVTMPL
jgi:hypothetical protein